jgi:hypothetical protein
MPYFAMALIPHAGQFSYEEALLISKKTLKE